MDVLGLYALARQRKRASYTNTPTSRNSSYSGYDDDNDALCWFEYRYKCVLVAQILKLRWVSNSIFFLISSTADIICNILAQLRWYFDMFAADVLMDYTVFRRTMVS